MPYRAIKPHSDRGSIKNLNQSNEDKAVEELPPTTYEIMVKSLYEHALIAKDQTMMESFGLIAITGSPTNPISIFRHREYVNSLSDKLAEKIQQNRKELDALFYSTPSYRPEIRNAQYKQLQSRETILNSENLIKVAGTGFTRPISRSFKRVS
jgi:hypothetical protein